ncbi:MAG: four-carbon acid sugar kinase family protein [Bacteroidales bacterium]
MLYEDLIKNQPEEYDREITMHGACLDYTFVILDDGITGCQTAHDVPVLFSWEPELLESTLGEKPHLIFIITNTRNRTREAAIGIIGDVMDKLNIAGDKSGRKIMVMSVMDSILHGHYPAEAEAIEACTEGEGTMQVLIPTCLAGDKFTCNDIHYVRDGETVIPVSWTSFVPDKEFMYRPSDLKEFVSEKYAGKIRPDQVLSFQIRELRLMGPENVKRRLLESDARVCVVNALAKSDLDVFASGAWEAILAGKKILFSTAPSFINAFTCHPVKEPMERSALKGEADRGGIVLVGSYDEISGGQLMQLMERGSAIPLGVDIQGLLAGEEETIIASVVFRVRQLIGRGKHVVIYTVFEPESLPASNISRETGGRVAGIMAEIVSKIDPVPSFIIVKGEYTAYLTAIKGLKMERATVTGQALPGVAVLVPGEIQNLQYIIFPESSGEVDGLLDLFNMLTN